MKNCIYGHLPASLKVVFASTLYTYSLKFDPRVLKYVFLGYKEETKGYVLFDVVMSRPEHLFFPLTSFSINNNFLSLATMILHMSLRINLIHQLLFLF